MSGEDAVARVRFLLAGFGVSGRLRLRHLSSSRWSDSGRREVIVADPRGTTYTAYLNRDGRVISLSRGGEGGFPSGGETRSLLGKAALERRMRAWLLAARAPETTRLASLTGDEKGLGRAFFPILRSGHPFVSHPRYGYGFAFVVRTGEFLAFEASENPPLVDPRPPRLDKAGALAALKRIWDTEITPEAINERHWRRVWYILQGEPELGYFLPEGRIRAILVWKVPFMSRRDVGHAIQGGSDGMLIDAITGERVPTKTVP